MLGEQTVNKWLKLNTVQKSRGIFNIYKKNLIYKHVWMGLGGGVVFYPNP